MNLNTFKKLICTLLCLCMVFSLCACSGSGTVTTVSGTPKIVLPEAPNAKYHTTGTLKSVCKSGLYELFVDEKNCSFALNDSAGTAWYAMPQQKNNIAAVLTADITDGETVYKLNSQDNSVAYGTAKVKLQKNGISFAYELRDKQDRPSFKVPVTLNITLDDGSLNMSVDCAKLDTGDKDWKISNIAIAPYFGAVTAPVVGDFIMLPDGSGALINLATEPDNSYKIETYGADYAVENSNAHTGLVAAFGLRHNTSAFAATVTEGDAISFINADISKKNGLSNAYASFNITPNGYTANGNKGDYALADNSYTGKLSVCYRFVSGSSASYSGIVAICREQFIREGSLSTRNVSSDTEVPINVTLIGGHKKGVGSTSVYTSFENAEDIVGVLKAKGINSLNLKYDGALSGGLNQKSLGKAKLLSSLGGAKELTSLENYMTTQGFGLYFSVKLVTSASGGDKASGIINNDIEVVSKNPLYGYIGSENFEYMGLSSDSITSNVVNFMNKMKDYSIPGYCIDDAGVLYSDFSSEAFSRQDLADCIFSQAIALSTNKNLMVETGNLYTLKNAILVSGIPMNTTYKETESYTAIPFVQMIFHGTTEYSGEYLNLAKDYNASLLKAIEYGALPAFEWTFRDYVPKGSETSALFYDNWTAKALEAYQTFNGIFSDLRGAKMTGHSKVADGLYCTVYNNETYIYVNYLAEDQVYNNLTIKAGSYLRVN